MCSLFLTAACGFLVHLTVNSTSPVPLHLLMRVRVWLAESCSSARQEQNSLGMVEEKSAVFHMKLSMDATLFFPLQPIPPDCVNLSLSHYACTRVLLAIPPSPHHNVVNGFFPPLFNPTFLLCIFICMHKTFCFLLS